jgi:pyruvate kinase
MKNKSRAIFFKKKSKKRNLPRDSSTQRNMEEGVLQELVVLRDECVAAVKGFNWKLDRLPEDSRESAENMIHCLWMRARERKVLELCGKLKNNFCIDIGTHETHNLAAINIAISVLQRLTGSPPLPEVRALSATRGKELLQSRKQKLYVAPENRYTAIMATLDPAVMSPGLLKQLLEADDKVIGRLNTAHDSKEAWNTLISHLAVVEKDLGVAPTPLHVDLAGPKLRTLPVVDEDAVQKFRPTRNERGDVESPLRITLSEEGGLSIDDWKLVRKAKIGDEIRFYDARKKKRKGTVVETSKKSLTMELQKTVYLEGGLKLKLVRKQVKLASAKLERIARAVPIVLDCGNVLTLVSSSSAGNAKRKRVPVDLAGALVRVGDRGFFLRNKTKFRQPDESFFHLVLLDDGIVRCCVIRVSGGGAEVECQVQTCPPKFRLKAEKGINLPDSEFPSTVTAVTKEDLSNLADVLQLARGRHLTIGLSFVRFASDVTLLHETLDKMGADPTVAVCVKIETAQSLSCLPEILLASLSSKRPHSVMIARGDLAAEIG